MQTGRQIERKEREREEEREKVYERERNRERKGKRGRERKKKEEAEKLSIEIKLNKIFLSKSRISDFVESFTTFTKLSKEGPSQLSAEGNPTCEARSFLNELNF